jgi:hypothetical protein
MLCGIMLAASEMLLQYFGIMSKRFTHLLRLEGLGFQLRQHDRLDGALCELRARSRPRGQPWASLTRDAV